MGNMGNMREMGSGTPFVLQFSAFHPINPNFTLIFGPKAQGSKWS